MVCTAWTFLRISKCSFLGRAATSLSLKTALTLSCFHKFSQAEACRPGTMILGTSESSGVLFFENIKPFVTSGVPVPQNSVAGLLKCLDLQAEISQGSIIFLVCGFNKTSSSRSIRHFDGSGSTKTYKILQMCRL